MTFLGLTFGGVAAVTTALIYAFVVVVGLPAALLALGGWTSFALETFYGIHLSWIPITIALAAICWALVVAGIDSSTRIAAAALIVEVAILLLVSVLALMHPPAPLSLTPLAPSSVRGGWSGLGLAFPLAVFLFVGFENSVALAEETRDPRRTIPRAVLGSIALMAGLYLIVGYATVEGFGANAARLAGSQIPFMTLAQRYLGSFAALAALAGFTSGAGLILAASNTFSRVLFNAARAGLLPRQLARVSATRGTPVAAVTYPFLLGLALALIVGTVGGGWENGFGYLSVLGTIPLIVVYGALNVAVLVNGRLGLSPVRRYVVPSIGVVSLAVPLWSLIQPGQPAPTSLFPWIVLAVLISAVLYAWRTVAADPTLPGRIAAGGTEGSDNKGAT